MLVLAVVLLCLVIAGADRLIDRRTAGAERRRRPAPRTAQLESFPDRVQDRWTALDDRQVARLLDDAAPC